MELLHQSSAKNLVIWLAFLLFIGAGESCTTDSDCCKNAKCVTENCICDNGYTGDGTECTEITCDTLVCSVNAKCIHKTPGTAHCKCKTGFFGDGFLCYTTPCFSNPCENGGICEPVKHNGNNGKDYRCTCPSGFVGDDCQLTVYPCDQEITIEVNPSTKDINFPCPGKCNIWNKENWKPTSFKGTEKPFCPIIKTLREKDHCRACREQPGNCQDCCVKEGEKCKETCTNEAQMCKECFKNEMCKEKCDKDPSCKQMCKDVQDECKTHCNEIIESCKKSCNDKGQSCEENEDKSGKEKYTNRSKGQSCMEKDENKGWNAASKKVLSNRNCPRKAVCDSSKCHNGFCSLIKHPSGQITCCCEQPDKSPTNPYLSDYQSYINFPRIHFAGKAQFDVPTVNNILENFNIDSFSPADTNENAVNWNPGGSGEFRIVDTYITRVCYEDGYCVYRKDHDPMIYAELKDEANQKVAAKLVDLDVEVQGRVSEIFGLAIEVDGFFKGDVDVSSFQSIWHKMKGSSDDYGEGTRFQSVIKNVQFGPKTIDSKIAKYFKNNMGPKQELSICFNIDLVSEDLLLPANFSFGRIVGSIGFSGIKSPPYFDFGRMLRPLPTTQDLSFAPFMVSGTKLFIDLGTSLGIDKTGNYLESIGTLSIGIYYDGPSGKTGVKIPTCLDPIEWIGNIYYQEGGGYLYTAGIYVLPIPEEISNKIPKVKKQIILAKTDGRGKCFKVVLAEDESGINIRPLTRWLFRAEVHQPVQAKLLATVFGEKPSDTDQIYLKFINSAVILRRKNLGPELMYVWKKNEEDASIYDVCINPYKNPKNIRKYIDGQIYALEYTYNGNPFETDRDTAMRSAIFVHVYDDFKIPKKVNWITHIYPIFKQYANLYPVMKNFMDLGTYKSVIDKKCHIQTAMLLDFDDPQFMPVTRDLSPKKTEMILKWLDEKVPYLGDESPLAFTKDTLLRLLQTALQLEHATIPVYLNGYLSIKPGHNEQVKIMLHDVLVDEMFHFVQVANIMNALEGRPWVLGEDFMPAYPSYLPGGVKPKMKATIDKISLEQIHDVYMEIETPGEVLKDHGLEALIESIRSNQREGELLAKPKKECERKLKLFPNIEKGLVSTNYNTIGDFYKIIVYVLGMLTNCGKDNHIFARKRKQLEWESGLVVVKDYNTALDAIKRIIDQGEGASPFNPMQANSSKELSHYFQFASIFHGRHIERFNTTEQADNTIAKIQQKKNNEKHYENYAYYGDKISFYQSGVWPLIKDPKMSKYKTGSRAYYIAKAFNDMYLRLLQTMQSIFDGNVERFDDSFGLMKSLIVYGNRVVQTPIEDDGDPEVGPNAAPTFLH